MIKKGKTGIGRIILGILSFIPAVCLVGLAGCYFVFVLWVMNSDPTECGLPKGGILFLVFFLLALILSVFLLFYYIFHAVRSKEIDGDLKPLWIAGLIIGNVIIFPVYWYINIINRPRGGKK